MQWLEHTGIEFVIGALIGAGFVMYRILRDPRK